MKKNNQKKQARKRRFTLPFTIFGLVWGVLSVIYILTLPPQNYDYIYIPKINWIWIAFLPAYLFYYLWLIIALVAPGFALSPVAFVGLIIFLGIIIAWLIGVSLYALILILKMERYRY